MPTFLTTHRMHPALVRRITASVRSETRELARPPSKLPRWKRLAPFAALALLGSGVMLVVSEHRKREATLASARAELVQKISSAAAPLTEQSRSLVQRVQPWLEAAAREPLSDRDMPPLSDAAFGALLTRPAVYVRGEQKSFTSLDLSLRAAAESQRDPFVFCLVEPPDSRVEKVIAKHLDAVGRGTDELRQKTMHLHRWHDAIVALHYLDTAWAEQVKHAERLEDVLKLKREWERAQVERKRAATSAEVLIFVLDEPKTPGTSVELDGASDHWVRVGIVDLAQNSQLYYARRHLNPSWISESRRVRYASGLDSCRLAYDLRAERRGDTSPR